jgi:TatD DNase family protein
MSHLIDSHSHLDASEFDADRDDVIARARAAGVGSQVIPAVTAASWPKLRGLCAANKGLYPAYGLHPTFLSEHRDEHLQELAQWLERERPVAVGECGLDFFVEGLDPEMQRGYFRGQLELAREFDLPVIVHARRAFDEVTVTLRRIGGLRGVVHSFSGSIEQAEQLWKLGFSLGIGGPISYPRAKRMRAIVASMPLEYLLVETDSPDQPLSGHQGRRNEPALLTEVVATIAQLRDCAPEQIARATMQNAVNLFGLPTPDLGVYVSADLPPGRSSA